MSNPISNLEPKAVWEMFAGIAAVPRPSKHEEKILKFLGDTAEAAGMGVDQDLSGNLVLRAPATPGFESAPTVILQGHVDMVCEKNADTDFDFMTQGIQLRVVDGWLRGTGTTLGADNGLGVAAALAAAMDKSVTHGPLEILLTVDEETGLTGANFVQPDMLKGRILLNLDSEELGVVYMGCAGGAGVKAHLPLEWDEAPAEHVGALLSVKGLRGGHSGGDIHENRGNAVKIITRVLRALAAVRVRLADLSGGDKHNAIPRESRAVIALNEKNLDKAREIVAQALAELRSEYPRDPGLSIALDTVGRPARVLRMEVQTAALQMLMGFPNGVIAISQDLPNLVETSSNLAAVKIEEDALSAHNSPRSSNASAMMGVIDQIDAVARLAGAITETRDPYPGWQPNPASPILALVEDVHAEIFGKKPERRAIHAGLETGIIGEKIPGIDMVSFGPEIKGAHSPDEGVKIDSVAPFWRLLTGVLEAVARGRYKTA